MAVAVTLFVCALASCTSETGSPEPSASLDTARLSSLGLTTEIPGRVRNACARASERATVRVICPKVIPDVPLFTPGAGLHGDVAFKPTYYMLSFNNGDPQGLLVIGSSVAVSPARSRSGSSRTSPTRPRAIQSSSSGVT